MRAIRWNLCLAVTPTAAALPVAAAGQLSPAIAGLAMLLSAGFVATNGLRLRASGAHRRSPIVATDG
jgi:cation transport ATPase